MTTAVVDASALVALLIDNGDAGAWSAGTLADTRLVAPEVLHYETANILRRHELAGHASPDQCAQAHADLLDLEVERWPYELLASRAWELRANLTIYDAAYVATAELTGAPLVTLDAAIARAPRLRCDVLTPGS